jgi:hypothetical protein
LTFVFARSAPTSWAQLSTTGANASLTYDDVVRAGDHTLGGEADRLLAASALTVHGRPRHRLGESRAEQLVTGDVADLRYGARDDIVDLRRVDTRARHEFGQAVGQQVHGQHIVQCAAGLALPDRGADRPDDD